MKTYIVGVMEVHRQEYEVEAGSEAAAKRIVQEGGGELIEDGLCYSHTLDSETWTVEEKEGE
jgi:hypothetical protein